MLIADAEGFWKSPNAFDVAGVLGLFVGVVSIWLTWWLARRDIEKRLNKASQAASEAARQEVRRVAHAILSTGVGDAIRSLELAREACAGKRWPRAVELCVLARQDLARSFAQPAADATLRTELEGVLGQLRVCVEHLRAMPKTGAGETPAPVLQGLDDAILALHRAEGRMTGIRPEGTDGQ